MTFKKNYLFLFGLLFAFPAFAQFKVSVNKKTGALNMISNTADPYRMNWLFASGDEYLTWQKPEEDWGLGKYDVPHLGVKDEKWTKVTAEKSVGNKMSLQYNTRCLHVRVDRAPVGQDYVESYTFVNTTSKQIEVSGLDIYTPFNDNYPDAKTCATNRCNAHVWPGMNSAYVNAIRMDGASPHLGLVLTKGAIQSYSIDNRELHHKNVEWTYTGSNVRGVIALNVAPFTLKPGGMYTIQWKLFWNNGWDDFFKKAIAAGFVKLDADNYVLTKNEKLTISINANAAAGIKKKSLRLLGDSLGEHTYKVYYDHGRKYTILNYLVISSAEQLIDRRVQFIVKNQQMNDPQDGRYGAYMVYDNDLNKIFTTPENSVNPVDRDEGRERLGMGVLVAKWLQTHQNDSVRNSLIRYVEFVRRKLQTPDYTVYSNIAHTSPKRSYNYPWVAHLYLETYKLTKEKKYLKDFFGTMAKNFQESGFEHYSIGFRVTDALAALAEAGMNAERDTLLADYKKVGDFFAKTGIYYPKHEVNYEQSIVAPAVTLLCEMYQVTNDKKYLEAAKLQLRSLEAFNGKQPDVHLNDIAIRHWDGYWFGKTPTWGDTMPQYWSTLTAIAFEKYYQCTGDKSYNERAKKIVEANLLNFEENGQAHCVYIYPEEVNGKPGKFYDQFANDQDWALVNYIDVMK